MAKQIDYVEDARAPTSAHKLLGHLGYRSPIAQNAQRHASARRAQAGAGRNVRLLATSPKGLSARPYCLGHVAIAKVKFGGG